MSDERRRVPRFPFSAQAELVPMDGNHGPVNTHVKELSLYGCYLETSAPLPRSTQVLVKIYSDGDFFEANATVVYTDADLGMGVAFRNVRREYLPVLQKWLQQALQEMTVPRI